MHSGAIFSPQVSNTHAARHPYTINENVIHQTRAPSSIVVCLDSDAHVLFVKKNKKMAVVARLQG